MNLLPPISEWPTRYRKLVFIFVAVAFVGVMLGAVFIEATTHLTPQGVVEQYKGIGENRVDQVDELKFPKPFKDMLTTTHNHILGLSSLFLIVGFLYLHAGDRGAWRLAVAIEPLLSLVVTFGGLWVMRYLWDPFVYIVILSGALMVGCYAWMSIAIMIECVRKSTPESDPEFESESQAKTETETV